MHTVLLIEDNLEIASMLRTVISRDGNRVLLAGNLAEAENLWSANKAEIQLVFTDNALPDGSGITFAERLLAEKPALKVIVASGMAGSTIPASFRRLDKPFYMSDLLLLLKQVFAELETNQ